MNKMYFLLPALALAFTYTAEARNLRPLANIVATPAEGYAPSPQIINERVDGLYSNLQSAGYATERGGELAKQARTFGAAMEVHVILGPTWVEVTGTRYCGPEELRYLEEAAAMIVASGFCQCDYRRTYGARMSYPWRYDNYGYGSRGPTTLVLPPPPSPAEIVTGLLDLHRALTGRDRRDRGHYHDDDRERRYRYDDRREDRSGPCRRNHRHTSRCRR